MTSLLCGSSRGPRYTVLNSLEELALASAGSFVLFLTAQWIVKASKCHMLHLLQPLAIFGGGGGGPSISTFRHPDPRSLSLHNFAISTLVLYLGILSPSRIFHSLRQICRPPAALGDRIEPPSFQWFLNMSLGIGY